MNTLTTTAEKKKALLIIKAYQMGCKEKKWRKRKKQRSRSKTDTDTCGKCRVVSCGNTSSRAEPCCGFSFVPHLSLSELLLYIVSFTKPGRALALKANEKRRVWKGGKKKTTGKEKRSPAKTHLDALKAVCFKSAVKNGVLHRFYVYIE